MGRGVAAVWTYVTINSGYNDGADHEKPVGERNVDLAMEDL